MTELNHLFTTNNDRYLATDRIMLVATRSRNSSSNGRRNTNAFKETIDVNDDLGNLSVDQFTQQFQELSLQNPKI